MNPKVTSPGPGPGKVMPFQQMLKNPGVKMVEGDDQVRAKKCLADIQILLQKYDCQMLPIIVLGPGGVQQASVQVVPVPWLPASVQDDNSEVSDNVG